MTQIVEPSPHVDAAPAAVAQARYRGTGNYIVHPDDNTRYSVHDNRLNEIFGVFNKNQSASSGLDVVFTSGEGYVGGHWFAKDTQTTYTLDASTNDQVIKVGVDRSEPHTVIIGKDTDFTSTADARMPIYRFDTDSTSITFEENLRRIGPEDAYTKVSYSRGSADDRFLHVAGDSMEGNLTTQSGAQFIEGGNNVVTANSGDRDIYVRSTEPSGWTDGDLWFEPE